ncbi:MAG: hypothetical protein E4H24_02650 [Thermomicrobiales bacterium]|nr:MAG: hypothetical protein E4H24_02650 [Thermomicrobiales bacterium]
MAARTIDCVECGATVAYGRLSCPDCGSLLASMAGSIAPKSVPTQMATIEHEGVSDLTEQATETPHSEPADAQIDASSGRAPAQAPLDAPAEPPMPASIPRQPNVYQPPMLAAAAVMTSAPVWPGAVPPAPQVPDASSATKTVQASPWSNSIDRARVLEISGWVVLVGAAFATLGFLLPWSRVVIGAGAFGGYLSTWGLASPTHLLVFLVILAVLGLAVVPSRVPAWLAFGVGGLALGGLLIGLSWPYLVGPLGADIGVLMVGLGGAILGIGGVMASWSSRHVEFEPPV